MERKWKNHKHVFVGMSLQLCFRNRYTRRMTLKESQEVWLKRTKRSTPNSEVGTDREQEEAQVVPVSCPPVATTSWRRITHITSEDLLPEINADEEFNVLQHILNDEDILQSDEFTSRESSEETEGDHHYNLNCRSQTQPLFKTYWNTWGKYKRQ